MGLKGTGECHGKTYELKLEKVRGRPLGIKFSADGNLVCVDHISDGKRLSWDQKNNPILGGVKAPGNVSIVPAGMVRMRFFPLIETWNSNHGANPEIQMREGDRFISVNGVRADSAAMMRELRSTRDTWHFVLQRGEPRARTSQRINHTMRSGGDDDRPDNVEDDGAKPKGAAEQCHPGPSDGAAAVAAAAPAAAAPTGIPRRSVNQGTQTKLSPVPSVASAAPGVIPPRRGTAQPGEAAAQQGGRPVLSAAAPPEKMCAAGPAHALEAGPAGAAAAAACAMQPSLEHKTPSVAQTMKVAERPRKVVSL